MGAKIQFGKGWLAVCGLSLAVTSALLLTGCSKLLPNKAIVECSAASAQEPVISITRQQLEKRVRDKLSGGDANHQISLSKIRAFIGQLVITIEDVRTSKEDPNSTKRFCSATIKVKFPTDMLSDAEKTRSDAGLNGLSKLADDNNVDREADSFKSSIDFNVQPTDDGSKVFAETETGNSMFDFAAEVLASGLAKSVIEDAQRAQQTAVEQQQASQDAALQEQKAANLETAKTENQLAVQTIDASWKVLTPGTRAQLLDVQRAWIRKKQADCRVEAAAASVDPTEIEIARLICDTRVTKERIEWLRPYRNQDEPPPAPDGGGSPGEN